ncbi:hypothetical protein [Lichenibacterium ramalinae]|uniref:Addiction module protein n=1 Tax=Lichenibacterium ramalinae TaxID=2316527 RepID=A0A4V1RIX3_9HYPH|nr:hypothetical protein [Lichenibacterium ramalinae]RYB06065.1 hypothetical protein D3272_07690 [Lichenibacterium ramalinae]
MSSLVDHAVERLRALPPEVQDEVARVLLQLTGEDQPHYRLTTEDVADLDAADAEIARGALATDDQIRAVWAKHGP